MIAEIAIVSGAAVIVSTFRFVRFVMQREAEEKKPKEIHRKTASKGGHEWTVDVPPLPPPIQETVPKVIKPCGRVAPCDCGTCFHAALNGIYTMEQALGKK